VDPWIVDLSAARGKEGTWQLAPECQINVDGSHSLLVNGALPSKKQPRRRQPFDACHPKYVGLGAAAVESEIIERLRYR